MMARHRLNEIEVPMLLLSFFNTAGLIFGPLIVLAGVVALILCFRASWRTTSPQFRRHALIGSLSPFIVGICGALAGLAFMLGSGQAGGIQTEHWRNLGKVCLSGLVVSSIPLLWCLWLFRTPRAAV
jgi:hypothetical protein